MTVANTILQQLGGNKFIAMTGATNLLDGGNYLSFKVMRNAKKVTHVRITLNAGDLYDIEYLAVRGTSPIKTIATSSDIYADMLTKDFEKNTGLFTKIF